MGRQHFAKGRELAGIDACRAPHAHHCETSMFWMRNRFEKIILKQMRD